MSFKHLSLRTKLIGMALFMGVVAQAAVQLMSHRGDVAYEHELQNEAQMVADAYIDKIDRNLFERYGDVQAFAVSEPARSGDPKRITDFMNDMMGTYAPIYDLMIVTNIKGRVIAVNTISKGGKPLNTAGLIGKDYSNEPWFRAAVNGEIEPGSSYVEDLSYDGDTATFAAASGRVMKWTAPIRDKESGQVLGVWTNRMSWDDVVGQITKEYQVKVDRAGKKAWFYLVDSQGTYLVHPESDVNILKNKDPEFEKVNPEGGSWIRDKKISDFEGEVVRAVFPSPGYSIYKGKGWYGIYEVDTRSPEAVMNSWILLTVALIMIGFLILQFWNANSLVKNFMAEIDHLVSGSGELRGAANQISSGAQNLASAATEQASALQQTASSIEEMNAMVKKSADNASSSREVAERSHSAATRGKQTVEEMIMAIEEINVSNDKIMRQIEDSNQQIGEIVKVIQEIGSKTKVINDIVFQTKLLSFNASVEAARAGEHGKGFAVVAEEVGNLAQMSGNAAKEIADMLNASIQRVESIVNNTKERVERLIGEGKSKVEAGTVVAKQCGSILEDVVNNVGEVNRMVNEISTASREQAQGINEITRAMNQLDQVTHENASTSQQAASSSDRLLEQADQLMQTVKSIQASVQGNSSGARPDDFGFVEPVRPMNLSPKRETRSHTDRPMHEMPRVEKPVEVKKFGSEKLEPKTTEKRSNPVPGKSLKVVGGEELPHENDPRFQDF